MGFYCCCSLLLLCLTPLCFVVAVFGSSVAVTFQPLVFASSSRVEMSVCCVSRHAV